MGLKADNWWLWYHLRILALSFKRGVKRANKVNVIDLFIRGEVLWQWKDDNLSHLLSGATLSLPWESTTIGETMLNTIKVLFSTFQTFPHKQVSQINAILFQILFCVISRLSTTRLIPSEEMLLTSMLPSPSVAVHGPTATTAIPGWTLCGRCDVHVYINNKIIILLVHMGTLASRWWNGSQWLELSSR